MAVMYPRTLFEPDLKSRAEGKVFDALEARLDDEWEVFHSAAWVVRDKKQGVEDGEIDFVLVHPEHGIVCLEVKGGGIECQHGEWYGIHDGKRERIRDPFKQAIDHPYDLRRKLADMPAKGGGSLAIVHAVAFPDITVHELRPGAGRAGGADHRPQRDRHDRRIDRARPRLPPGARERSREAPARRG